MRRTRPASRTSAKMEAERLVATYADMILRLSYTYLHSTADAEDICQTVLLRVMTGSPTFSSSEHERAWIVRTTINACKDLLRSAARRTTVALEDAGEPIAPGPPDDTVAEAVSQLPRDQREAIYLHYYEGYSIAEVAGLVGASEAAVTKRLSRARQALRNSLGGQS